MENEDSSKVVSNKAGPLLDYTEIMSVFSECDEVRNSEVEEGLSVFNKVNRNLPYVSKITTMNALKGLDRL